MWFIYILLSIIAVVILFLCVPIDFTFSFNSRETPKLKASFIWFWIFKNDLHKKLPEREKTKRLAVRKTGRIGKLDLFVEIASTKGLLKQLFLFGRRVFKSIKIREFTGDFEIGLDDPIDNAWLFAFAGPVNYFLNRTNHRINIMPVFSADYYFYCDSEGSLRVYPIIIIGHFLRLVLTSRPGIYLESDNKKMEKRKIISENPVHIGDYTLVPVVSIMVNGVENGIFFSGSKKIVAVVIISPAKVECFSIDGSVIPLGQILEQAPDLNSILGNFKISQDR